MPDQCKVCPSPGQDKVSALRFTVEPGDAGTRLDLFLARRLAAEGISREKAKQLIREGCVRLGHDPAHMVEVLSPKELLAAGQLVRVNLPEVQTRLTPEEGDLDVLYEDEYLAVINKPAGLTVHPCPSCPEQTLAHRLAARFSSLHGMEGFRPGIVHRLDKDTSGLMLAALTDRSRLALAAMFAERAIHKEYLALVRGVPREPEGVITDPIGRHPVQKIKMAVVKNGKPAKSAWRVLYADPGARFALIAVRIFTGRTHQIRVHMAHVGHPLWGDAVYGPAPAGGKRKRSAQSAPDSRATAPRQMLHAWRLSFNHPLLSLDTPKARLKDTADTLLPMSFTCPPPPDFLQTALALSRRMQRLVITGMPGCGKSSLARELEKRGLAVFSADDEVRRLYEPGGAAWGALFSRYGSRFVPSPKSSVDKRALGEAMRQSQAFKREVESLVHPLVRHSLEAFWREREQAGDSAAAAEIPLFLETGFDRENPPIILVGVACPFAVRRERLKKNRGWDDEGISAMESWQWPEKDKMAACRYVVDNSGPESDLPEKAETLLARLDEQRKTEEEDLAALFTRLWTQPKQD